jgi:hypothetical protein
LWLRKGQLRRDKREKEEREQSDHSFHHEPPGEKAKNAILRYLAGVATRRLTPLIAKFKNARRTIASGLKMQS